MRHFRKGDVFGLRLCDLCLLHQFGLDWLRRESGSSEPKNHPEGDTEHLYSFHTTFDLFNTEAFKNKIDNSLDAEQGRPGALGN